MDVIGDSETANMIELWFEDKCGSFIEFYLIHLSGYHYKSSIYGKMNSIYQKDADQKYTRGQKTGGLYIYKL